MPIKLVVFLASSSICSLALRRSSSLAFSGARWPLELVMDASRFSMPGVLGDLPDPLICDSRRNRREGEGEPRSGSTLARALLLSRCCGVRGESSGCFSRASGEAGGGVTAGGTLRGSIGGSGRDMAGVRQRPGDDVEDIVRRRRRPQGATVTLG